MGISQAITKEAVDKISLSDIQALPNFIKDCEEQGIATEHQIRWWLRYRNENGLISSGAITEKRPNPKSHKPMLFVIVPRFVAWMATAQTT